MPRTSKPASNAKSDSRPKKPKSKSSRNEPADKPKPASPAAAASPSVETIAAAFWPIRGEPSTLSLRDSLDSPAELDESWPAEYRGAPLEPVSHRQLRTFRAMFVQGVRSTFDQDDRAAYDAEVRSLQADTDILGGELAMPPRMVAGILQSADDQTFMRSAGTVIPVGGADGLGIVSLDADPDAPVWTSELGTGDEDKGMRFGGRELKPNPLAKRLKMSRKLIQSLGGSRRESGSSTPRLRHRHHARDGWPRRKRRQPTPGRVRRFKTRASRSHETSAPATRRLS